MAEAAELLTPDEWGERFREDRGVHESFTERLVRLMKDLLDGAGIEFAQLSHRTKEVESFVDKIRRKNEKYEDPLRDMTDLTGIRLIAYYQEDVPLMGDLIEKEFDVDWDNSSRYRAEDPERFGYRSDHYVVRLSDTRLELAEYATCAGLRAEIQVRTVMQHAWAAVDHKISYKASGLPPTLRRRLSRLSALLEVADEQFSMVRTESTKLAASYRVAIDHGTRDLDLDQLSLAGYLVSTGLAREWAEKADAMGFGTFAIAPDRIDADIQNRPSSPALDDLLTVLQQLKASTIEDVDHLYAGVESWGPPALETILDISASDDFTPFAVPGHVLAWLALARWGDQEAVDNSNFRPEIRRGIMDAIAARESG